MKRCFGKFRVIMAFMICAMLLRGFLPAKSGELAGAAERKTASSDFYNTYWRMRSYTGLFDVVFYENGTYLQQAVGFLDDMRESGTWSYANGVLYIGELGFEEIRPGEWCVAEVGEQDIALYPGESGFDFVRVYTYGSRSVEWTDAVPYIDENNRTMVPLRAVAEDLYLDVTWNQDTQTVTFTGGDVAYEDNIPLSPEVGGLLGAPVNATVELTVGSRNMVITYESIITENHPQKQFARSVVEMDTEPVIRNERTYLPIRYLAEAFGLSVSWDGALKEIALVWDYIDNPFE